MAKCTTRKYGSNFVKSYRQHFSQVFFWLYGCPFFSSFRLSFCQFLKLMSGEYLTGTAHLLDILLNTTVEETPFIEILPKAPNRWFVCEAWPVGFFISRYAVLHSVYHGGWIYRGNDQGPSPSYSAISSPHICRTKTAAGHNRLAKAPTLVTTGDDDTCYGSEMDTGNMPSKLVWESAGC
jgi:hypothetical protein